MKNTKDIFNIRMNSYNRNLKGFEKCNNGYKLLLFVIFTLLSFESIHPNKLVAQNNKDNEPYQENGICLHEYSVNESTGDVYIYVQCSETGSPSRNICDKSNIPYADAFTFEVIEFPYSKDCNNVYYFSKIIEDADVKTFQIIGKGFSKDDYNVFAAAIIIPNADPKTVSVVNDFNPNLDFYIKDNDFVYFCIVSGRSEIIEEVDPSTFIFLNRTYAKDKNRVYCRRYWTGKIKELHEADPQTFKAIDIWSGKDKNNVYNQCSIKN